MQYRPFGDIGEHVDEEKAIPVIQRAYELGVTYFDTAPYYCNHQSEIVLGKAVKPWRDEILLSTKCPIDDADGARYRQHLETSLRRLDVQDIDFYHTWGLNWKKYEEFIVAPGGPLDEARRAREEGLIRHVSFSFHDTPQALVQLIDTGHFESMTVQYNLLDRANEQAIHHAREKGLGVVIMGPVGGGRLAGFSPEIARMVPGGVRSNPEIALRFVLSHRGVSCALSGMSTIQMVEENAATASREEPLSEEERAQIMAVLDETKRLADLYCTACGYCLPCPHDVNIPKNFEYMNYYRVYGLKEYARQAYADLGVKNTDWIKGLKAEYCIQCGECEPKCPQHIPIMEQLEEVARVLGGAE